MDLKQLIWQNWCDWSVGGVDEFTIGENLEALASDMNLLQLWVSHSFETVDVLTLNLSPKFFAVESIRSSRNSRCI